MFSGNHGKSGSGEFGGTEGEEYPPPVKMNTKYATSESNVANSVAIFHFLILLAILVY